ncbi:SMP-30/gluconolactonase/LRE family protein [Sinorhizobium meliloti]|uniref:SMP-30/gluconolactonase/LRE family protein n=1 Tax=Rhizobium meliloti TaxID=382 RepID=UPI003B586D86
MNNKCDLTVAAEDISIPELLPIPRGLPRRAAITAAILLCVAGTANGQEMVPALKYDATIAGAVPIPPSERTLQAVGAQPWFKVSSEGLILEGPAFERNGDLLFCDVFGGRVLRVTRDKQLSTLISLEKFGPGGVAVHKDGRIFIAAIDFKESKGEIIAVKPDGSGMQTIVPPDAGYMPNDLVFDAHGGFYFTDFRGSSTEPTGGVYYVASDSRAITPVLPRLAKANGIALSPDGKFLWVTEYGRNLLHRVDLTRATATAPFGTSIAYHFTGPAPDSMRADKDGNLYVAMNGQGRVLIFNRNGIPIGQVLLPERDEGHNLASTSLALRPGTDDMYIVTSDRDGGRGANIFHAKAFVNALPLYSDK